MQRGENQLRITRENDGKRHSVFMAKRKGVKSPQREDEVVRDEGDDRPPQEGVSHKPR
jgi:hypothetical protein